MLYLCGAHEPCPLLWEETVPAACVVNFACAVVSFPDQ